MCNTLSKYINNYNHVDNVDKLGQQYTPNK